MADGKNGDTRIPVSVETRDEFRKMCDGAGVTYDTMIQMLMKDVQRMYASDPRMAGLKYIMKKEEKQK